MLKKLFLNEIKHLKKLTPRAQRLIVSFQLYEIGLPIVSTFLNTLVWQNSNSLTEVIYYYLAFFLTLPIGFLITRSLLKRYDISKIAFIGLIIMGSDIITLNLIKPTIPFMFSVFGLLDGIGNSFYWASRNFLIIDETKDEDRNYFVGIDTSRRTLVWILIPPIFGFILTKGGSYSLYSKESAYLALSILSLVLFSISGIIIQNKKYARAS